MSWMDSWSRPTKHAVTPPPLYLTAGEDTPYCHSCGRVIGSRKAHVDKDVKYCAARCRHSKPGPLDRKIEALFATLLSGQIPEESTIGARNPEASAVALNELKEKKKTKKKVKGEDRIIVECSDVEAIMFGHQKDPEKVFGRKKNRAARGVQEKPEDWRSVDMVDDLKPKAASATDGEGDLTVSDVSDGDEDCTDHMHGAVRLDSAEGYGGGKIRPPQAKSDVNGSVGGEKGWAERIEETEEMKAKRLEGHKRTEERDMVKKAARRGCAFGFTVFEEAVAKGKKGKHEEHEIVEQKRKCEAVMKGAAVEASYAKGDWGIRWREKV